MKKVAEMVASEGMKLWCAAQMYRQLDRYITWKGETTEAIEVCRLPDDTMWVGEAGTDCDGADWGPRYWRIHASLRSYMDWYDGQAEWDDGPTVRWVASQYEYEQEMAHAERHGL